MLDLQLLCGRAYFVILVIIIIISASIFIKEYIATGFMVKRNIQQKEAVGDPTETDVNAVEESASTNRSTCKSCK